LRMVFHEAYAGGEIVEEPAQPAVVEVDKRCGGSVDQKVGEAHVCMDQAIAVRSLAKGGQPAADQCLGLFKDFADFRSDVGRITPIAPIRFRAKDSVGIPDEAS